MINVKLYQCNFLNSSIVQKAYSGICRWIQMFRQNKGRSFGLLHLPNRYYNYNILLSSSSALSESGFVIK